MVIEFLQPVAWILDGKTEPTLLNRGFERLGSARFSFQRIHAFEEKRHRLITEVRRFAPVQNPTKAAAFPPLANPIIQAKFQQILAVYPEK